jgi:predicted RNA polymerase sigma factor
LMLVSMSQWDQALLACGALQLERAAQGDELSEYQLQAAIAAVHATSASFAATDWLRLVELYDELLAIAASPVVALNRAIAQSMVDGPENALASLEALSAQSAMKHYHLLPAVRADLLRRLGRRAEAATSYLEALTYPCTEPERRFILRRIDELKMDTYMRRATKAALSNPLDVTKDGNRDGTETGTRFVKAKGRKPGRDLLRRMSLRSKAD